MPAVTRSSNHHHDIHSKQSKRLILCFDGTGNAFQGNPGDTNIVKIYNMLDRGEIGQMHYYQPGIGTYPAEGPVNVGFFRSIARWFEAIVDQALATSFDAHVIAGYRFIMRFYSPGDRIYIFGFSRGAFTARFLARMISHIGLLSQGNEELIPFAYKVYQKYEQNRGGKEDEKANTDYMNAFKKSFCRTERDTAIKAGLKISRNESGVKVHFLGLFDCVNSVGTLDAPLFKKPPPLPAVRGTAEHIRHAVAIDERRVKFKAALFAQEQSDVPEDIKEVWFAGNHGDVGGGWGDKLNCEDPSANVEDDYFQLSDIALKWMMDEADDVDSEFEENNKFKWDDEEKASFLRRFHHHKDEMIKAKMHDTMTRKGGAATNSIFTVMLWNFMERFPFIRRWEFVPSANSPGGYSWEYVRWPLNSGNRRDIPSTALFHHSVIERMRLVFDGPDYRPTNPIWVKRKTGRNDFSQSSGGTAADDIEDGILLKKGLDDLAKKYKPDKGAAVHEESNLLGPHFVHRESLTKGSVAIEGADVVVGPSKWDRIYHVEMK